MFGLQSHFQPKFLDISVGTSLQDSDVTFGHIFSRRKVKLQLVFTNLEWESFHPAGCALVYTDSVQPVPRVDGETRIQHMGVVETGS